MKTDLFDFTLPESLIAAHPASPRDASRMLVVNHGITDDMVASLPGYLKPGDVMVFNDTKVIPARLFARRGDARIELLLHKQCIKAGAGDDKLPAGSAALSGSHCAGQQAGAGDDMLWQCFARPAKKLKSGDTLVIADGFEATVLEKLESGEVLLKFPAEGFYSRLGQYGHMPLPPYIERQRTGQASDDATTYQTVYARHEGSVAAPTAGLHFTDRLLAAIDAMGVKRVHVTLHVGGGTFLPVKADDTKDHVMHSEYAVVTQDVADTVNKAKAAGGRVVAVGTTSMRTLESATDDTGQLQPFAQETSIFITPGYRFRLVDVLMTNFHLPKSTLFMLVSAFSGLGQMQAAYRHAIAQHYRFYSYGDACLLFPDTQSAR